MAKSRYPEKPLGGLMEALVKQLGWEEQLRESELKDAWPEVVGERIAQVTEPLGVTQGTLRVKVATPMWRQELGMMTPEFLPKLQKALPRLKIKSIRWT